MSELMSLPALPTDLAKIICEYTATWQFLPWVEELAQRPAIARIIRTEILQLWENPNGIDMALRENLPTSWYHLSANSNPWAVARLKENPSKIVGEVVYGNSGFCWDDLPSGGARSINCSVKEKIGKNSNESVVRRTLKKFAVNSMGESLCYYGSKPYALSNPHPRMVAFFINKDGNDHDLIYSSPTVWENPSDAMLNHLLSRCKPEQINWRHLSANSNPVAIDMLRANPQKINWSLFLTNPGIFTERADTGLLKLLTNHTY